MLTLTLYLVAFVALVVFIIQVFRLILTYNEKAALLAHTPLSAMQKKNPNVDIGSFEALLTNLSLVIVLGIMIIAFDWKSYEENQIKDLGKVLVTETEVLDIPITQQTPPPPPKLNMPVFTEVADIQEVENEIEVKFSTEMNEDAVVEKQVETSIKQQNEEIVIKEEKVEEIFTIVEEPAAPLNGLGGFYTDMAAVVRYPEAARSAGVEGKVFVEFVINKEGKLTDFRVVKGIGFGCDEEAVRILTKAANWKPAKQRGRPVLQRMVLPITFKLRNNS